MKLPVFENALAFARVWKSHSVGVWYLCVDSIKNGACLLIWSMPYNILRNLIVFPAATFYRPFSMTCKSSSANYGGVLGQ